MKKRGFTLVEIMIVVAIIALLAAIAIPNLLGARRTANDAAARANIKVLCTEAETYSAGAGDGTYYADLATFRTASAGATMYCAVGGGATALGGYNYTCVIAPAGYTFTADRVSANTGNIKVVGNTGAAIVVTTYP